MKQIREVFRTGPHPIIVGPYDGRIIHYRVNGRTLYGWDYTYDHEGD